ncbi:hypothetical protein [Amycolatopsis sp. cmx-11-51]|uniref:hypothetical protein n=1 Tax=Amycolatopsis sp. cmx-11-51 TaxID=2785797 RepID=UPI0039E314C6
MPRRFLVNTTRSRLDAAAGKLTESSRRFYRDLVGSADWSRFGAVETASSAATPPPVGQDAWRVAAGHGVSSGAYAAAAEVSLLARAVMAVVMLLARRLPIPIIRCPARSKRRR